ncbi:GGDEF domain-containing protein [Domibacillus indicus]|nr:diguanylate cyclase [Domibacillus indicus]MCM3787216.1 GGDEF domain-containing protein [Domibacillus indicus]
MRSQKKLGLLLHAMAAKNWPLFCRPAVERLGISHEDHKNKVITVSIGGAALTPQPGDHPSLLIRKADEALYTSKRKGRARNTTYESVTL